VARNRKRRPQTPEQAAEAGAWRGPATASAPRPREQGAGAGGFDGDPEAAGEDVAGRDEQDAQVQRNGAALATRPADSEDGHGGEHAIVAPRSIAPSPWLGARAIQFLRGSWRELQRVQWPDRPQVMQATGVVIGFVIVAGVFLGVSDFLATKIVNFILR